MESDVIAKNVNERYAQAVTNGEEMCCPMGYDYDDLCTNRRMLLAYRSGGVIFLAGLFSDRAINT